MFQYNNRAAVPHSPQSIGQRDRAARITKLRDALHRLWIEKCTWGKHLDFYHEAQSAYTAIGRAGGHVLAELLDDIDTAMSFNRDMQQDAKKACYEANERVLKATLSGPTIERHNRKKIERSIEQAAFRARCDAQRYA
jgi:hypothetical protein